MVVLALAAIAKCHRLGVLNCYLLNNSWSPRSGCYHGQFLVTVLFLTYRWPPFYLFLTWQGERERDGERRREGAYECTSSLVSFYNKDANPIMKALPSRPHLNLITPPPHNWPHLQISSYWRLGFQCGGRTCQSIAFIPVMMLKVAAYPSFSVNSSRGSSKHLVQCLGARDSVYSCWLPPCLRGSWAASSGKDMRMTSLQEEKIIVQNCLKPIIWEGNQRCKVKGRWERAPCQWKDFCVYRF